MVGEDEMGVGEGVYIEGPASVPGTDVCARQQLRSA